MPTTALHTFTRRDLAAAFGVVLIWGLNFVAMKWALQDLTAMQLGAARYLFAALPWVLLVRPPKIKARWWIAYGMSQGVGQFGLLFIALQIGMTAALASVLMQTQVFFTALFGYVLLHETLGKSLRLGLLCAALGLCCFCMDYVGEKNPAGTTMLGFAINLLAASMWGMSNIIAKRAQRTVPQFDALGFVVWSSAVPVVPFILGMLLFDPASRQWQWTQASITTWFSVAYLGWFATILAYALWTRLLMHHPANRVAPFSLAVPMIGLSTGVIVLGEAISSWQWLGIVFIILALGLVLLWPHLAGKRSARDERAAPTSTR